MDFMIRSSTRFSNFVDFVASQPPAAVYLVIEDVTTVKALQHLRALPVAAYKIPQTCSHLVAPDGTTARRKKISAFASMPPVDFIVTGCRIYRLDGTACPVNATTWKFVNFLRMKDVVKSDAKIILLAYENQCNDRCSGIGWESFGAHRIITENGILTPCGIVAPRMQADTPHIVANNQPFVDQLAKSGFLAAGKNVCLVESPLTWSLLPDLLNAGCRIYHIIPGLRGVATPDGRWLGETDIVKGAFSETVFVFIAPSPLYPSDGIVRSKDLALVDTRALLRSAGLITCATKFVAVTADHPTEEVKVALPYRISEHLFRVDMIVPAQGLSVDAQ